MRRKLLLPLVCPRFARGLTAHSRERRDHQPHQLHVNLNQFYFFIWLLLVTKKQSISNRPLWPSFSAPFLSLIYPWVFNAGFLYRGYSATCRAPGSTSWLKTPDFAERNCSRGQPFFAFIKRYVIFYFMNKADKEYDHLRSNQGRNQDFSRGTNIFLLSPPPRLNKGKLCFLK